MNPAPVHDGPRTGFYRRMMARFYDRMMSDYEHWMEARKRELALLREREVLEEQRKNMELEYQRKLAGERQQLEAQLVEKYAVELASKPHPSSTWFIGYSGIFLGEYYLATGDQRPDSPTI